MTFVAIIYCTFLITTLGFGRSSLKVNIGDRLRGVKITMVAWFCSVMPVASSLCSSYILIFHVAENLELRYALDSAQFYSNRLQNVGSLVGKSR